MNPSPESWQNRSPGDLSILFPSIASGDVDATVQAAAEAAPNWARVPLSERIECLREAQRGLLKAKDQLAYGIALEVGKPLTEALGEVGAVIAKIDLTITDAETYLADQSVTDGPHPARVRRRPLGPAAVIGPFNFPLHLGHGANVAHLLAGNPVIFKPSLLAANIAAEYGAIMSATLPADVFCVLQGGGAIGEALCLDPRIRAVCFTGSVPVGRALARALAEDYSKELALELGGHNSLIVCADADLEQAALAAADGVCLTTGQRCNATSRIIVEQSVAAKFEPLLLNALAEFEPGDPLLSTTRLGPLVSSAAIDRYLGLISKPNTDWLLQGKVIPELAGRRGYYVRPAVRIGTPELNEATECFVPIVELQTVTSLDETLRIQRASPFGLTASIFTRSQKLFLQLADQLEVGNVYANLPTTFSPSTLPFGGFRASGNGRPGGRGIVRFTTREQAIQSTGFES